MSTGDGLSVCPLCGFTYYQQIGHTCRFKYSGWPPRMTEHEAGDYYTNVLVEQLRAENARLKEALAWYADLANYSLWMGKTITYEQTPWERARKALEAK